MAARAGVLRRMAIRRAIAAEIRVARLTRPQVHPSSANLLALAAFTLLRGFNSRNHFDMRAVFVGHNLHLFRFATPTAFR